MPIVLDVASARLLASFPGLVLPAGYLDRILSADRPPGDGDPRRGRAERGAAAAVDGVAGVNLSGGGGPGEELRHAAALAEISRRLGGLTGGADGRG